jgi:hypothetical protein
MEVEREKYLTLDLNEPLENSCGVSICTLRGKISDRSIQDLKIQVPQRSGGQLEHAVRQPQPQQSVNQKPTNAAIVVAAFAPLLISALTASLGVRTRRRALA